MSLRLVEWITLVVVALTVLLAALTVSLKALRVARDSVYKSYSRRIEPALERYLLTGEKQPEFEALRPWERHRFLSTLMIERMAVLRGTGRDYLVSLASELGMVDRYLRDLRSRSHWRRARAAEYLGYFGGEAVVGPVTALLSDGDETVRAVAARALARIGTPSASVSLVRTLDNPSNLTRLRAAENLERLGSVAVEALSGLLMELTTHGSTMAARVLGNLRAREARPALRRALRYAWDLELRAQATLALGKIGDPDDLGLILASATHRSWPVRAQAAKALGMIGEVDAIPRLKEMAGDREWWVRINACNALANMGPSGETALLEVLASGDRFARDQAAATLEARGVTRRMVRALDKSGKRGERARAVIGAIIGSGTTRYLRGLLERLPGDAEERAILAAMLTPEPEPSPAEVASRPPEPDEPATDWVRAEVEDQ